MSRSSFFYFIIVSLLPYVKFSALSALRKQTEIFKFETRSEGENIHLFMDSLTRRSLACFIWIYSDDRTVRRNIISCIKKRSVVFAAQGLKSTSYTICNRFSGHTTKCRPTYAAFILTAIQRVILFFINVLIIYVNRNFS